MATDDRVEIPGDPDSKPYKVDRVTKEGEFVSRVAEYATEAEAKQHKRRLDWHYKIHTRGGEVK